MIGPVPIKISDFFGNLGISASPFGWASWFVLFASLEFQRNEKLFDILFFIYIVVMGFLSYKCAHDTMHGDEKMMNSEFRFIAGSGIGSSFLALVVSLGDFDEARPVIMKTIAVGMCVLMIVIFAILVSFKKEGRNNFFNFTQCYLIIASSFSGFLIFFLTSPSAPCPFCAVSRPLLASACIVFWLISLGVLSYNFIVLPNKKEEE
jgi:hypothetical protein